MEDAGDMIKITVDEIEKVLGARTVVGDPITIEGNTLIPLISIGFGFGAGAGSGMGDKQKGTGSGAGSGGAAGVKPVGVVVINKDGVRIEPIMGGLATAIEKLGESVPVALEKFMEKWWEKRKEG